MISTSQITSGGDKDTKGVQTYSKITLVTTGLQPKTFKVLTIEPSKDGKTATVTVQMPDGKPEVRNNVPLDNKNFRIDGKPSPVDLKSAYASMYGKKELGLMENEISGENYIVQRKLDGKYLTKKGYEPSVEDAMIFTQHPTKMDAIQSKHPQLNIIPVNEEHGKLHYWGAQPKGKEYGISSKPDEITSKLKENILSILCEIINEDHEQEHGYSEKHEINLIKDINRVAQVGIHRKQAVIQDLELIKKLSDELLKMHNELQEDKKDDHQEKVKLAIKTGKCMKCGKKINPGTSSTLCPSCHEESLANAERYLGVQ